MTKRLEWRRDLGLKKSNRRRVNFLRSNEERSMATGRAAFLLVGLMLGGCMQSTLEPAAETNLKPRDKQLLAKAPYEQAQIPEPYRRHIVDYHRKESPGTIVVDTDARYLYFVLAGGKAIRYGVTVGEDAQIW